MPTSARRFAAVAVLAVGLLTIVSPVHSHAQAPSVSPSVRAVLKPLYPSLYACTSNIQQIRILALYSVVGSLQDGGMSNTAVVDGMPDGNSEPNRVQGLASWAATGASSCGTVVRLVHHTHLSGQLARNTTLRHVLDQLAAYGSNAANGDYYYVKVATDIQSDDAASTKVDMDNAANAWHSADGHLAMVASYIGKF